MLTPEQNAQLEKLMKIKKTEYIPLSERDIENIKERVAQELENVQSRKFKEWVTAWNKLCEWATQLAKDNSKLLMEVEYWRSKK